MRIRSAFHRSRRLLGCAGACLLLGACGLVSGDGNETSTIPATALLGEANATPAARRATEKPSGVPATRGVIVQAGDSIGVGLGADNWAAIEHLGLPKGIAIHNVSVSGQWMLTGLGQRDKDLFPFRDKEHTSVLLIQQGTNDLFGGSTAAHLYGNILKPFVAMSQAAGFYVAVNTVLPRRDSGWMSDPAHEQQRLEYNQLVRANSIGADAVIDVAADPEIGDRSDPGTSSHYADGVHLRQSGQERLAKMYVKPLGLLLQYPPRTPR
jgi:lysophospholipase L1-like esterase